MGGLALKNLTTPTRRYLRDEYDVISEELVGILKKTFSRVQVPLFYSSKDSFGDADIVVAENTDVDIRSYIQDTFQPQEIFHNGNCWSFDYKDLQVDIIMVSEPDFDAMTMYLSYNDLGNMIGVIARGFGLKYGQEGLTYDHEFKGIIVGRILVSTDYPRIFKFLGLDYERYTKGFETIEDIFTFVSVSPYFNGDRYQFDQLNKINRDRNKKRKSYLSLLEWIGKNIEPNSGYKFDSDKSNYFSNIDSFFHEARLKAKVREIEYLYCKKLYLNSKFNGGEIKNRFGIAGAGLGKVLAAFEKHILNNNEDFDLYILNTNSDDIYSHFETFYNQYLKINE